MSRTHNVKTPGAVTPQPAPADTEVIEQERHPAEDLPDLPPDDGDVVLPDTPAVANAPDVQAMIQAGIERGVAQALKAIQLAQSGPAPAHVELPDQSAIDPSAIRKEVLTKQGYVVPHTFPGQAEEQNKFPNAAAFRR